MNGSVELSVEVLWGKAAKIHWDIGQKGAGKDDPGLKGIGIKEGLEDAAGRARGIGDVHLHPGPDTGRRRIPHIGNNLPGAVVHDNGSHISYALRGQRIGPPSDGFLHSFLQPETEGGPGPYALGSTFHIVGSISRKRQRLVGKGFLY